MDLICFYELWGIDYLITSSTVVLARLFIYLFILICLWWRDFPFIIFQYFISVSKPIIGCYKQVYFPKHSNECKTCITLLLPLQKIRELVSETHLSKHELVKVYTCVYLNVSLLSLEIFKDVFMLTFYQNRNGYVTMLLNACSSPPTYQIPTVDPCFEE